MLAFVTSHMFSGDSIPVTFRMKKHIMNDVMDWFGTDIALYDETEDEITARATVNWHAIGLWRNGALGLKNLKICIDMVSEYCYIVC